MKRKKARATAPTADELVAQGQASADRGELADAEAKYREAIAIVPDHLVALALLGLVLVAREAEDEAINLLVPARELDPEFAPVHVALGAAYAAAGHDELAVAAMETAVKLDSSTIPLERLAKHHIRANRPREAIGLLRRIMRRDPSNAQAKFLLAALTGSRAEDASTQAQPGAVPLPPPELIADLFDTYASSFDEHLVDALRYHVPRELRALLASAAPLPDRAWTVIDLGCGTGLAGVELRGCARTLIGSDLSRRMIARARQRGVYDELHVEDLVATLGRARDVDLIVAADVFIYVGTLEATFAGCAAALRPGGRLAFSIERSAGDDVILQTTLRYAHSEAYIARLAGEHGLAIDELQPTTIRLDHDGPIGGLLYVLRKT